MTKTERLDEHAFTAAWQVIVGPPKEDSIAIGAKINESDLRMAIEVYLAMSNVRNQALVEVGSTLEHALLDLVRLCSRDNVGHVDLLMEDVVADGRDVGAWVLRLDKLETTEEIATVKDRLSETAAPKPAIADVRLMLKKAFAFRPQLTETESGSEPSLKNIVKTFYRHHMLEGQAADTTLRYFDAILASLSPEAKP